MNRDHVKSGPSNEASAHAGSAPLVRCRQAGLTFGSGANAVVAVRDVSCAIVPGARVAVTGPSGSGKSTLLHLLAGLVRPTSGSIEGELVAAEQPAGLRRVGLVFQSPSLIPALDVLENVALPLILAGTPEIPARAAAHDALALVGIDWLESSLPEQLSGGQAQRAAVARVLACAPRLILADEPTGQLDHATGTRVIEVLIQAADSLDAALVVSTHDPLIAGMLEERWQMQDGGLRHKDEQVAP
ncbi:MAG: transporter ATP-binding protein [Arthrobacter sp.]|jgi:putative ABC transport system ATP-binding protein|nr:transporter ATP-binding protein [Arthrobacter sp.]